MNRKLLSMLLATGVTCVVNPLSAEESQNDLQQPAQSVRTSTSEMDDEEEFSELIQQEPTAAGATQDELRKSQSRKWHAPDGTRTWEELSNPDQTQPQ